MGNGVNVGKLGSRVGKGVFVGVFGSLVGAGGFVGLLGAGVAAELHILFEIAVRSEVVLSAVSAAK